MQKQEKSRKPLIIGIIAAVVILAILLILLLTQCTGGQGNESSSSATVDTSSEVPTYQLYWNADRAEYDGKSEAGMSSRMPEEDGYFHVRFILDGEEVVLKVADRKLINAIDVQDVMGLEFDEDGIVIGVLSLDDMPLEKIGWQFFVQSGAKTLIKLNSSQSMNGMEVLLELTDPNVVYDMSGLTGPKGIVTEAIEMDKVMAVANLAGEITHVFIYERPNFMLTHEGYCMHCDKDVTWYEWVKTDSMPVSAGHYQLQNDIQLKGQPTQQEDAKTCIDLNGKRVDGASGSRCYAMFNAGTTLAIMDTSEEQTGVMAAHGTGDQGMVVWVRYGAFYLYGGTLDASDATSRLNGVAVECGNGKYFYMNGGTIIGGTAKPQQNDKGNWTAGLGGALNIGGKFVMNDGVIKDGYAETVITAYNTDGTPKTYQRGMGGNIFLSGTAVFEMNGGTISNGRAGNLGGNIYADGAAELTITGGRIEGGTIYGKGKNGGSIYLSTKTTTTMSGGVIYGGTSRNCGGNIYLNGTFTMMGGYIGGGVIRDFKTGKINADAASRNFFNVNGKFSMYGGTIVGGYQAIDTSATDTKETTVLLSGYAKIYQDGSTHNLTLNTGGSGIKVVVGKLVDSAKIGVNTTAGIFSDPTQEANTDNFVSDIEGADVVYYNKCLALGRISCVCGKSHGTTVSDSHINGCDGEILLWAPWTSASSVPTSTGTYFLLKDVTTTSQSIVSKGKEVKLDLNGKNITLKVPATMQDGFRLYRADNGAKLTLTDTTDAPGTLMTVMPGDDAVYPGTTTNSTASVKDADGKIIERVYYTEEEMRTAWKNGNFGMLLWARGGQIIVHNGIFDGSNLSSNKTGMVISVGNNTETNAETGEKTTYYGSLTMYGGTVIGGYTKNNGNVNVGAGATMNLYGGTITGGRAYAGGNVNVGGILNMYGGTITDGVVDRSEEEVDGGMGGNINVADGGVMNMSGGVVSNGTVVGGKKGGGHGGNFHVYGTLNATGGTITGGTTSSAGGNIGSIGSNSLITLDGVQVTNGTAGSGGNVSVYVRSNKGLYILGDTVISGGYASGKGTSGNGGNISVNLWYNTKDQDQIVVIDGATITDGKTAGQGGNIYFRNATTDNFKVVNEETGEKKQDRWKIGYDVTMKSGTITGGVNDADDRTDKTKANGGSIFLTTNTNFTMEGGTISGGDASDGGGNIYSNGVLTVKGGTITGGTLNGKTGTNGNIFVVNATLAVSGGVIDGDVTVTNTTANASKILLSGTPVINKGKAGGLQTVNYNTDSVPMITIDDVLGEKSVVYVNGVGYVSNETKAENAKYVISTNGYNVMHLNERVFVGEGHCICGYHTGKHINGCDGTMRGWAPWTSTTSLPTNVGTSDGHWYLTGDVTITSGGQQKVVANKHVVLDLNGKTVNGLMNNRVYSTFNEGSNLTITDASEAGNGTIKAVGDKALTDQGGVIWGRYGTITIHNGIFDGSQWRLTNAWEAGTDGVWGTSDDKVSERNGAAISGSKLVMYGGTIIGGVCEQYAVEQDDTTIVKAGGSGAAVSVTNFDMYGGTIKDGKAAKFGGNVYVSGTFNMYGGEILNGSVNKDKNLVGDLAYGGNVYATKMTMSGGTISGGIAYQGSGGGLGGNVVVVNDFAATGGTITGGVASTGGNLGTNNNNSKYVLDGVTISDGQAGNGGNIAVNVRAGKSLTITGNTAIVGGKATTGNGGNLYLNIWAGNKNAMEITISGEALKDGTAAGSAGQIFLKNTTSGDTKSSVALNLNGATVSGGTASDKGGNIYLEGGVKITAADSVISDGVVTTTTDKDYHGGNVYVAAGSEFVLDGDSQVLNGHAGKRGGNFYVNGTLTINDGLISGGHSGDCGGNIHVGTDGQINMSGGTITEGFRRTEKADGTYTDAVATHSNVYLVNGDINMTGGKVTGSFALYQSKVDGGTMTVGKDARITANDAGYGVTLNSASGVVRPLIQVDDTLSDNAAIYMSVDGFVTSTTVEENEDNFYSVSKAYNVYFVGADMIHADGFATEDANKIYLGQYHCICGANDPSECIGQCEGKPVLWTKWTKTDALPLSSGYWYLTGKVTSGQNKIIDENLEATDMNIVLDLNGFDVVSKTDDFRLYNLFADQRTIGIDLTITDTAAEKGTISSTVRTSDQGAIIWARTNAYNVNLYNVNIDGTNLKANAGKYGIVIAGAGDINLYGNTTIIGGAAERGTAISVETQSALHGKLYMDQSVTIDGTIYVDYDTTIDVSGLTDASEFVVDASGTFTINNGITDKAKFFTSDEGAAPILLVDGQQFAGAQYCICGVDSNDAAKHLGTCGNKTLNWRPWRSATTIPTKDGNWYLTADVTRSGNTNYESNIQLNLDLNDHTITQSGKGVRLFRVFKDGASFTAKIAVTNVDKDNDPNTGKVVANTTKAENGTIIWLGHSGSNHEFSIYGGIWDASGVQSIKNGTVAYLAGNGVLNIYGGEVISGSAAEADYNGGGIFLESNAVMNMYGGTVRGGKAPGDPSTGWGGYGGNVAARGTLNMYGGIIKDGQGNRGGNVCLSSRGTGTDKATLNMYGGIIAGGVDVDNQKAMCKINLYGGTIDKQYTSEGVTAPATSLLLRNKLIVNAEQMTSGSVGVSTTDSASQFGIALAAKAEDVKNFFFSEQDGVQIVVHNTTELHFGRSYCLCGASKTEGEAHTTWCTYPTEGELQWIAWDGGHITESGNYYVPTSENNIYNITAQKNILTPDKTVNLDLNGQTVQNTSTTDNLRGISVRNGVHLGITDTVGGGKLLGAHEANAASLHLLSYYSGTAGTRDTVVNLYAGTLGQVPGTTTGTGVVVMEGHEQNGKAILNMYGGTIEGGTATTKAGAIGISKYAQFNQYGGTISGGNAPIGATIYLANLATFNQHGGTIEGGSATKDGGAVYLATGSEFVQENGTIEGGSAVSGGNIYLTGGSEFVQKNGTIEGGSATSGGNVYLAGGAEFTQEGGTISAGTAVNGGNVYVDSGAKFHSKGAQSSVTAGTVTAENTNVYGGNFYVKGGEVIIDGATVSNGASVVMTQDRYAYGGSMFIDGTASVVTLCNGAVVSGGSVNSLGGWAPGGNIYLNAGTLNVTTNSEISGGYNAYGKGATTDGNNIYINYDGVVNLTGGSIINTENNNHENILMQGGKLNIDGGSVVTAGDVTGRNIYGNNQAINNDIDSSRWPVITLNSGSIVGGSQSGNGGSVYLTAPMTLNVNGGTITGGTATGNGGNVYVTGALNVSGGTIAGGLYVASDNVKLSGSTLVISKANTQQPYSMRIAGGKLIDVSELKDGADVSVTAELGAFAKNATSEHETIVKSETFLSGVHVPVVFNSTDNMLYLGQQYCLCGATLRGTTCSDGCDGTVYGWTAWQSTSRLPTEAGNYYLTGPVTLNDIKLEPVAGATIRIDLRGNTISMAGDQNLYEFAASAGVTIIITDSTKDAEGSIVYTGTSQSSGGIMALKKGNTFSLYRATLDANGATLQSTSSTEINGVVASVDQGATFNIYSGTVIGGSTIASADGTKKGSGGSLAISGTLNMYGGTIRDGEAANYAGNIANWGTVNLFGGTVTGGKAPNGGNIGGQKDATAVLNTKNVVISNGAATSNGGNIYSFHNGMDVNLGEGTVVAGGTAGTNGGNIYMNVGNTDSNKVRTLTIDGAQILGGSAKKGANVYANRLYEVTVADGTVSGGTASENGGNFYIASTSKLTISGGSVGGEAVYGGTTYSGGSATYNGGSICVDGANASIELKGGELANGVTQDSGGNLHVRGGAKFTMTGGTIKNGTGRNIEAANVFVQNSTFDMSGGQIWGGVAVQNTNASNSSVIRLSNDAVIDGTLNNTATPSLSLWSYNDGSEPDIVITAALTDTARIGINEADCIFCVAGEFNEASLARFFADQAGQTVLLIGEDFATKYPNYADGGIDPSNDLTKLYIGRVNCVCGNADNHDTDVCDKSTHLWFPTKSRPTINNGGDGVAHYWYLTAHITHSSDNQSQVNVDGTGVYLDLNGYNITATDTRMYRTLLGEAAAKVTLVLTNTSSTASTITVGNEAHDGRILWLGKNNSTGIVYNINVEISDTAGISKDDGGKYNAKEGAAFAVGNKCTLMMKKVNFTSASEKMGFNGVFLRVSGAETVATLKDCSMTGAKAKTVQTVWPGQTAYGNTPGGKGGAIYALNATLNLINTSITGNSAETNGGAVYMGGTSVLNVSGTTNITGNTLTGGTANNIYAEANATVNIVETTDSPFTGTIGLAGGVDDPIVSGITSRTDSKVGKYVVLDDSTNYQFMAWSDGLGMTSINNLIQCECGGKAVGMTGHTCEEIVFTPWESATTLPSITGNYFLMDHVITTNQTVIKTLQSVRLDLNGKNVTYQVPTTFKDGFRLYRAEYDGKLILTDHTAATSDAGYTAGSLKTVITGTSDEQKAGNFGMIMWLRGGHAVIYGGVLDGSDISGSKQGMTISMSKETPDTGGEYVSTLTIYGGLIKGATSSSNGPSIYNKNSTVTMYGGTISGGTSTANGGSIYLDGTSVFTMKGGVVEGGTAQFDLSAKKTRQGGNFYVSTNASLYVEGDAIIRGGTATDCGGNIHVVGKLFVKDNAQIVNGRDINYTVSADNTSVTYSDKFYSSNSNIYLVNGSLTASGGFIDGSINSTTTDAIADLVQISGSAKIGTVSNVDGEGRVTATYGLTLGTWSSAENKNIKNNHITVSGTLNSDCSVAVHASANANNTLDPVVVTGLLTEAEAACFVPTNSTVNQLTVSKTEGAETYQLTQSAAPQQ